MKKLLLVLSSVLLLYSCNNQPIEYIRTDFIEGTVSCIKPPKPGGYGISGHLGILYVQSPTQTIQIALPIALADKWKVGDTIIVITEQYKEICK